MIDFDQPQDSSGSPSRRFGKAGREELVTDMSCSFPRKQVLELSRPWSRICTTGGVSLELTKTLVCRYIRPQPTLSIESSAFDQSIHYQFQDFLPINKSFPTFTQPQCQKSQRNSGRRSSRRPVVPSSTKRFPYTSPVQMRFSSTSSTPVSAILTFTP